ncbi:hypothetical protein R3I93_018207 [Phoxinus phoxinus]|uniref:Uncharacterized protein n=1 Tax=Phoxinus phoxinus TaxID=58324 RepID=A0AAN9CFZ9_9TELE
MSPLPKICRCMEGSVRILHHLCRAHDGNIPDSGREGAGHGNGCYEEQSRLFQSQQRAETADGRFVHGSEKIRQSGPMGQS